MHWRGHSTGMQQRAVYADVVREVRDELAGRLEALLRQGLDRDRLVLDPGLGFAKNAEHNWALLAHLDAFTALGCPLLVGASRKRFLGTLVSGSEQPAPVAEREAATVAVTALAAAAGAWAVRVHTARANRAAVEVAAALDAAALDRAGDAGGLDTGGLDTATPDRTVVAGRTGAGS
jgi:dihydropteroate synthase